MTIINVLRQSHSVHVFADGLAFSPSGGVKISTKLRALPHVPAIVGVRANNGVVGPFLQSVLDSADSYDDLKSFCALMIQARLPEIAHILQTVDPAFEIIVAGISESTGLDSFEMASHDKRGKPWIVEDLPALALIPCTDVMALHVLAEFGPQGYDDYDPVVDCARLMEIQRQHWAYHGHGIPGGFVQLMSLHLDRSITTRIVHRWPVPAIDPASAPKIATSSIADMVPDA